MHLELDVAVGVALCMKVLQRLSELLEHPLAGLERRWRIALVKPARRVAVGVKWQLHVGHVQPRPWLYLLEDGLHLDNVRVAEPREKGNLRHQLLPFLACLVKRILLEYARHGLAPRVPGVLAPVHGTGDPQWPHASWSRGWIDHGRTLA